MGCILDMLPRSSAFCNICVILDDFQMCCKERQTCYDADLFIDAEAETNYKERFSTSTPLVEREVTLEDLSETPISSSLYE